MSSIHSVNRAQPKNSPGKAYLTGIDKSPTTFIEVAAPGPMRADPQGHGHSGVLDDFIGNGKHHGGTRQAVYAFAQEEMDWWANQLDRDIAPGSFGENLTTIDIDVDSAEIDDVWHVGTAVLRVTGPRIPCATFTRQMGLRGWVKTFAKHGRSGAYLAVDSPGRISPGDAISVTASGSGITVPTTLRAFMGDSRAASEVLEVAGLYDGIELAELRRIATRGR